MLHYNPQHVLSINMSIFRRTNCIITASGIITLCKWLYSTLVESRRSNCIITGSGIVTLCKRLYSTPVESRRSNCIITASGIVTVCKRLYSMPVESRRSNCIMTASGIVTLCKQLYSTPVESSLLSTGILYSRLQRVTIPDAVIIQFDLLKMSVVLLETCQGL